MENADPNVQKESREKDDAKKPPKAGLFRREVTQQKQSQRACVIGAKKKEATKEEGNPQEVRTLWINVNKCAKVPLLV